MSIGSKVVDYPSRFSGQGSLAKPAFKVIPLVSVSNTSLQTRRILTMFPQSGSCLMYTRQPTDFPATIQVAFDELVQDGANVVQNWITLSPGNSLDIRPGQWNQVTIQAILPVAFGGTLTFGNLIISDGFIVNEQGGLAASPAYIQPGFRTQYLRTSAQVNGLNEGWIPGWPGTGIFTYAYNNVILLTVGQESLNYSVTYKNIGSGILYVSGNPALTNGADLPSIAVTYPIAPGQEETFEGNPLLDPNTVPTYVYSGDAGASLAVKTLIYGAG